MWARGEFGGGESSDKERVRTRREFGQGESSGKESESSVRETAVSSGR